MSRYAIVGAGVSGLAAAVRLRVREPEAHISLYEKSDSIGGVIRTEYRDNAVLELGADNFATLLPAAYELSETVGYANQLIAPKNANRRALIYQNARLHSIPDGFSMLQPTKAFPILTSSLLSPAGKLRLLREALVPARSTPGVVDFDDESLESFATRRLGREAFERLVEPLVCGIFTARADRLSMAAALPQFWKMEQIHGGLIRAAFSRNKELHSKKAREQSRKASGARYDQFRAPAKGMADWLQKLAKFVFQDRENATLHLSSNVQSIQRLDRGFQLLVQGGGPQIQKPMSNTFERDLADCDSGSTHASPSTRPPFTEKFDGVILCTPSFVTAELLKSFDAALSSEIASIEYASSAVVGLLVPRTQIPSRASCFGIVIPQTEKRDVLAISFTSEKYPGRVADDLVYLRVFMAGAVRPELFALSDAELTTRALRDVQTILKTTVLPVEQFVQRWPSAMPQYTLGHCVRVSSIQDKISKYPKLAVAGAGYAGVGIPQCVMSANAAVDRILE